MRNEVRKMAAAEKYSYGKDRDPGYTSERRIAGAAYEDGSAVRRQVEVPERRQQRENPRERRKGKRQQPIKSHVLGFKGFCLFIGALACVVASTLVCVHQEKCLNDVRSQVTSLRSSNEEDETALREETRKVNDSTDLSSIYKKAVNKLGMVRASESRVYKFKESDNDLVRQYADIPKK